VSSWKASTGVRAQLNPRGEDEVADADYVNFIRRFPPSKLVSLVAAVAPDYAFNQADYATNNLITPWGLADVTRVSLTFSNEYRAAEPTVEDLLTCLDMHNRLGHPGLKAQEPDAAANTVLQLAFYQFPFQRPAAFLTGRSIALFEQTLFPDPSEVEVMHSDWQNDLLGCTLSEYTGVTQLLAAAAKPNGGRFDPAWIEKPELQDLTDIFDPTITRRMLTKFLAAPASGFRQRDPERSSIGRRFTFNPLVEFPVVSGLGSDLLMPVPDFVLRKPTPSGLYFTGLRRWGEAFTRDLGKLFEAYVGRHLALIPGATLHPEIVYGKNQAKSIDWILVFPDLVLLVEVKLARPKQAVQSGAKGAAEALRAALDKAHKQLDTTYELIQSRQPEFEHIPADRLTLGIVVTLEDFHVVNSPLHRPWFSSSTKLPTLAVPVEELEGIVCLGPATSKFLTENITSTNTAANLRMALSRHTIPHNPILTAGLDATPIRRVTDVAAAHAQAEATPNRPRGCHAG
jgi:hypothetical protein